MRASYPAYKSTSIPWLPEMPEHWDVLKVKHIFQERSEKGYPDEPLLAATQTKGVVRKEEYETRTVTAQKDFHLLKLVKEEDFVISLRSFQGGIEYAYHRGIISPAYTIFYERNKVPVNKAFYRHLFKSHPFINSLTLFVTGIREGQNIDYAEFKDSLLPFPPLPEQTAIANYLDAKTEQINRFIEKKEKLIALLKEQKQAVINELLEDKEGKWERRKLKYASKVLRGKFTHRPRNDDRLYGGKYPFIQTNSITSTEKYITEYNQTLNEWGYSVSKEFPSNTVVMSIAANIADIAILNFNGCFPDSIIGFVPNKTLDTEFLFYSLKAMKDYFYSIATINTQLNLNIDKVANSFIKLPDLTVQKRIVKDIEIELGRIDSVIVQIQKEIEKLKN
jgi:Restriction endonuclease S subunits